jgi:hypothetical protein
MSEKCKNNAEDATASNSGVKSIILYLMKQNVIQKNKLMKLNLYIQLDVYII